MSKKIKRPKEPGKKIDPKKTSNKEEDYPVFCFKHLNLSINSKKDHKFYLKFIERLTKISTYTWSNINVIDKHSYGTEKIPRSQINCKIPDFITPDVEYLTVFRANGDNRPFVGFRRNNVFHILFIEEVFGHIYKHGNKK